MKAITICQPFAHMIALPDDDEDVKRVENRGWTTSHRGTLAIHAGKSKEWLMSDRSFPNMVFGAVVAVATLADCFVVDPLRPRESIPEDVARRWPWLLLHRHVEGPACWLLAEVYRLEEPVLCSGQQGLWTVPSLIEERIKIQMRQEGDGG